MSTALPPVPPLSTRLTPDNLGGLRVASVRSAQQKPNLNFLVYGNPGVGKTVLLGSADAVPEMRPVLAIDVEGGTYSLNNTYPDVDVVRVTTWGEMQALYDELLRGKHPYRTITLDSLTEIQKFSMAQIMKDLVEREPERDPDIPSVREWGKNIEQIRRLVRAFRDLPVNVVFTALSKEEKDQKTGTVSIKPYLSGKLADEVAGFLDIVCYYYVRQAKADDGSVITTRKLLTGSTGNVVAKDRSGSLPLVLEEPTMSELYKLVTSANRQSGKTSNKENK